MSDEEEWICPKEGCTLGVEQHDLALAMEHIYGGTPSKSGRNFDADESQEVAGRVLDKLADAFGLPHE